MQSQQQLEQVLGRKGEEDAAPSGQGPVCPVSGEGTVPLLFTFSVHGFFFFWTNRNLVFLYC